MPQINRIATFWNHALISCGRPHPKLQCVAPAGSFRLEEIHVGYVRHSRAHFPSVHPRPLLLRLLVKRLDGGNSAAEEVQRDAVVNHLEESNTARRTADLIHNSGAGFVHGGEVDGWDFGFGIGFGSGFEVGEGFWRVNEERGDGLDSGIDEALDSGLGLVEFLDGFGAVERRS